MNHALAATGLVLNLIASVMFLVCPAGRPIKNIRRDWRTNHRAYIPFVLLIVGSLLIAADLIIG